jgi:glycosyltransferase involved in cell wall biosynthesis
MKVTVIIPTRDRPDAVLETVSMLASQDLPLQDYEIIVVDDGSRVPLQLPSPARVIRRAGGERSTARNTGAREARGGVLVFLDDDITVSPRFLTAHWAAQQEWPGVLAVGRIDLPEQDPPRPFVRFRRALECAGLPARRGLVTQPNSCTAANMSIRTTAFHALGGFAEDISSGEDQDFALRHSASGGRIAYLPEAVGVHRDHALDLAAYCRRAEWGSEHIVAFCRRHPDWPDNQARERLNGFARWGREPWSQSARKAVKGILSSPPATALLRGMAWVLERTAPDSAALDRVFRATLGAHIFRGYRRGLRRFAARSG